MVFPPRCVFDIVDIHSVELTAVHVCLDVVAVEVNGDIVFDNAFGVRLVVGLYALHRHIDGELVASPHCELLLGPMAKITKVVLDFLKEIYGIIAVPTLILDDCVGKFLVDTNPDYRMVGVGM